ncbi:hypothetical protein COHA_005425 [Chlorella ohadii]|uniref:Rhamnogalacturonase A/B/Epimerase-like pectate lyase domain-containing protein n=1 Tax=Chlorella ohadii TaxID=2649997 RepID=A0AAD5DNK9_9CHLO|nr:hypothetical protein COHA_005425 [Chlorella ohadii]
MNERVNATAIEPGVIQVGEGAFAYAGCSDPAAVISQVILPAYGNPQLGCNSSLSYVIVAAACLGDRECLLLASSDVFTDECPGAPKSLQFTYIIDPNSQASSLWGDSGELYRAGGRLGDWSQAGYGAMERDIPNYPNKYDVKSYGARGDGSSDDSDAIQKAINAAASEASRTGSGVAVYMPAGSYRITSKITIESSRVVLRGSGKDSCKLIFPNTLQDVYGSGNWAFGGGWLGIVGKRADSRTVQNKLTDIVANANRGDYRVRVSSTNGISVGQWVKLYQPAPDNTNRRRLLSAGSSAATPVGRKLRQDGSAVPPPGKVTVLGGAPAPAPAASQQRAEANGRAVPQWYSDPAMQAALEAAVKAQWAIADALVQEPDRVPAQALEPNGTNPLGLDPMFLAAAYYGSMAWESEMAEEGYTDPNNPQAPATAASGSLESYLYGNNVVDSGTSSAMFPGKDRVRFVSRVKSVGNGYVEFERPLPYDVRTKWEPVLHRFAPSLVESGFEGFSMVFDWSAYPDHLSVNGNNGIVLYDMAHCWVKDVRTVDADNGVILSGGDFVTITGVDTQFSRKRGTGSMGSRDVNGHHALWTSYCTNVLVTNFDIAWRWYHDLSVDSFAESTVYSSGKGVDINADCHRAGVHNNLFTNIDTGRGTRAFQSGGAKDRGANSAANNTWWNMHPSDDGITGLPSCSFGPLLNFFGLWGAPGSGKGGRRLLAGEAQAAAASGRVRHTSLAAGAVTDPGRVQAAAADDWQDGGSTDAPQDGSSDSGSGSRAWANAESWCTREGWWVEQVSSGKGVWPPDLHRAQVDARRSGRLR